MKYLFFFTSLIIPVFGFSNDQYFLGIKIAKDDMLVDLTRKIYYLSSAIQYEKENDLIDDYFYTQQGRLSFYKDLKKMIEENQFHQD